MAEQSLLPISSDAQSTLLAMARMARNSVLRASPLCSEHPEGQRDVRGWVLDTPEDASAGALPLCCSMFDGVTVVQATCSEAEVLALLSNESDTRHRLGMAVRSLAAQGTADTRASWRRCRPTSNGHPHSLRAAVAAKDRSISFIQPQDCGFPVVDSEPWHPELSHDGFVGLYHYWHQGSSASQRRLRLYMVCQSYLPKACLEFADTVRSVAGDCTALHVCLANDTAWLRRACSRNRARIIAYVCAEMGIPFPRMQDYHAQAPAVLAIPCTETLHNDIAYCTLKKQVRVLNYCAETARAFNGSACVMAPWDCLWIMHGAGAAADAGDEDWSIFGAAYGDHFLPTSTPRVAQHTVGACSKSSQLSFVSADVARCRVMQVWGVEPTGSAAAAQQPQQQQGQAGVVCTDGLPDDVAEAYRRSIARSAAAGPNDSQEEGKNTHQHHQHTYLQFDEAVLQHMASRGWRRSHGYSALIPLACAVPAYAPKQ